MMTRTGAILSSFLFLSCATTPPAPVAVHDPSKPKSIILLIADGAGAAHFTVGRIKRGADFQIGRLATTGLVSTSPLVDSIVTDSAAAATAYASGVRTRYTALGVDEAGKRQTTALELAEEKGKSTGLVTTANFWDATVAAFAAHTATRYETDEIIRQMLASGAEIVAGGGVARFGVEGRATLEEVSEAAGYSLARSAAELSTVTGERILAVFPTQPQEVDFNEVRLPALTRWAIDRLSPDPEGFFLVIEHEGTDGASHANMTDKFVTSMLAFDEAVGVALELAAARNDTLIIVTGDHETGGLQIHAEKGKELELRWATKSHTGEAVPIFALGPGAERFGDFMDGEDVGRRIQELLR
jgi:alkaline phosphatase